MLIKILVAGANAVCSVTYITQNSGIPGEFQLIHGIGNVERVVLPVFGKRSHPFVFAPLYGLTPGILPGVTPVSLATLCT